MKDKCGVVDKWQAIREKQFWQLSINDILQANVEGLQIVYKSYTARKKVWMNKEEAMYMMTKECENLKVNQPLALKCYAMCKMTVQNEETQFD